MFGQNSLLTSRTRRWRKVNEQNRQGWGGRLNDFVDWSFRDKLNNSHYASHAVP